MYWPFHHANGTLQTAHSNHYCLGASKLTDVIQADGDVYVKEGTVLAWHLFDVNAGLDVDADTDINDW